MGQFVLRVCVTGWLMMMMCSAHAHAASEPSTVPVPRPEQTVLSADDMGPLAFPDVSRIDPRLVFLGGGVLLGLAIASPGLELSEVLGIALGVIGSQYLYYSMDPRLPVSVRPGS